MNRKIFTAILALGVLLPGSLGIGQNTALVAGVVAPATSAASRSAYDSSTQQPQTVRPQPPARHRSAEHERQGWHRRVSKKEWIFLGAIAGSSMGIGAVVAGAKGLAIGAIVGGWGAYAAHRLWNRLK